MAWKKHKSDLKVKVTLESGQGEPIESESNLAIEGAAHVATNEPYVHWAFRDGARKDLVSEISFSDAFRWMFNGPSPESGMPHPDDGDVEGRLAQRYGNGVLVPLPKGSRNSGTVEKWNWEAVKNSLPDVGDDTIIVGVIDTGISLGHRNFRDENGKTRFIASWQQGAQHDGPKESYAIPDYVARKAQLPMGRELFESEINEALKEHSSDGHLHGWLDEDSFNRELGLVDPSDPYGQRDLDLAAAHGTHVLDLAAGHIPCPDTKELMHRQKIIAVNLPAQDAHGTAGNFLAYLADQALRRIIFLADALWKKNFDGREDGQAVKGYPIVINFSYGMQAGPKDGTMLFERALHEAMTRRRVPGMNSQIRIAMPAGNEAQNRGAATIVLGEYKKEHPILGYPAEPSVTLPWRLVPEDHTPNYLEIWTEKDANGEDILKDLELFITPPNSTKPLEVKNLKMGYHYDLGEKDKPIARVYCQSQLKDSNGKERLNFLVCTAPTAAFKSDAIVAPAGAWTVELRYEGEPVDFQFHVQSDQSAVRTSKNAMRSYLDHENYETHISSLKTNERLTAPFGGMRDTYHYDPKLGYRWGEKWLDYGPVQRMRTHNALASTNTENLVCIASHIGLTGRPAFYSGPTEGNPQDDSESRTAMTVSFIGETAPSLFGLLGAGSRNGSTAAYRGTSMSTALATRQIVEAFTEADWSKGDLSLIGTEHWLRRKTGKPREVDQKDKPFVVARKDHWDQEMNWRGNPILKTGVERLDLPDTFQNKRVRRLGGM